MAQVPRHVTMASDTTVAPMLVSGLAQRIGNTPVRQLALLLLAQIWLETSRGQIIQNNVGNEAAGGFVNGVDHITWSGDYWRPPWYDQAEIDATTDPVHRAKYQAQHVQMLAGEIPSAFRAFGSLQAGLESHLDLLFHPVYHPLLAAAATGDALAFAQEIKRHYNPDKKYDPVATSHTLDSLVSGFNVKGLFDMLPKVPPAGPAPEPPSSPPQPPVLTFSDVVVPNGDAHLFRLSKGVKGALVSVWQSLMFVVDPTLAVTGEFDLHTETVTKQWQAKHGLDDDGVVGKDTWGSVL